MSRDFRAAVLRGVALFLAGFTLLSTIGDLRVEGGNGNLWWIDLWPLPTAIARFVLIALSVAFFLFAAMPAAAARARRWAVPLIAAAAGAALLDVVRFYVVVARGEVRALMLLPLSALVVCALLLIAAEYRRPAAVRPAYVAVAALVTALAFPVAQVAFFGTTDYTQPADVAVVFGAHAYADGRASDALADRVATGVDLYKRGLVRRLFFSGGPGDGRYTEPQVMRALAEKSGVPREAIVEDPRGVNTEATARNTAAMLGGAPLRVLAVSHFYHLPRIKMACERYGLNVRTVPSRNTVPYSMPYNIAREELAFWAYYVRRLG